MQRTGYAAAALRVISLTAGLALFSACAASRLDTIQVGPWFASKNWKDVAMLASRGEITHPWGAIAVIHGQKISASDVSGMESQKLQARKIAAKAGADALIVAVEMPDPGAQSGVYQEQEAYLSALAVKYISDVSSAPR